MAPLGPLLGRTGFVTRTLGEKIFDPFICLSGRAAFDEDHFDAGGNAIQHFDTILDKVVRIRWKLGMRAEKMDGEHQSSQGIVDLVS